MARSVTGKHEKAPSWWRGQRGVSLIVFTLVIAFVIIPMMGLGIDAAVQYWIKAKLSAAVDSAVLAAARSLNGAANQTAYAQSVGQQYFAANFPTGILGTTVFGGSPVGNSVTITVTPGPNVITVSASAQVYAPLYFTKMLHLSTGVISASSQSTRRNTNIILVLDRSGSMNNASNSCAALVGAVESFTNKFINGRDQLGMVTFSTTANVDYAPNLYFASSNPTINGTIDQLVCVGATSTPQAMYLAYQAMKTINAPGALNVILFFTDGNANTIVANYPVKTKPDYRYDSRNTSSIVSMPASSCNASSTLPKGGFTAYMNQVGPTGYTGGVFDETPVPIYSGSSSPALIGAPGCMFSAGYNAPDARADVAYIPNQDYFGSYTTGYKPADTFPAGYAYAGQIRPDDPEAIRYAAMNATDSVAQNIRADSLSIVTYTIGLTGNESIPMDNDFMERIANDPRASNYNSSQQQGMFVVANDNASLSDAFNAIAAQILRLSR